MDEFCQYYGRRDSGLCFPDFHRKLTRGPASNYLDLDEYEKIEDINRFVLRERLLMFKVSLACEVV